MSNTDLPHGGHSTANCRGGLTQAALRDEKDDMWKWFSASSRGSLHGQLKHVQSIKCLPFCQPIQCLAAPGLSVLSQERSTFVIPTVLFDSLTTHPAR